MKTINGIKEYKSTHFMLYQVPVTDSVCDKDNTLLKNLEAVQHTEKNSTQGQSCASQHWSQRNTSEQIKQV